MDNNSLVHTKRECKYHIGATCDHCLKCATALLFHSWYSYHETPSK
jgi:hypothetical protein